MDQKKGYITTIYSFYPFFQKEINIHSLEKTFDINIPVCWIRYYLLKQTGKACHRSGCGIWDLRALNS